MPQCDEITIDADVATYDEVDENMSGSCFAQTWNDTDHTGGRHTDAAYVHPIDSHHSGFSTDAAFGDPRVPDAQKTHVIEECLIRLKGNLSEASRELGITRSTLRRYARALEITDRGAIYTIPHTAETDAIIIKNGSKIGLSVAELASIHGKGWYYNKVKERAIFLKVISPDDDLTHVPKVCIHTDATDAIILKHGGYISPACKELGWGNTRAVRQRAIQLGLEIKKGAPIVKYVASHKIDEKCFALFPNLKKIASLVNWPTAAVRRRCVELGICEKNERIPRIRQYVPTKQIDRIIRKYKGHVATIKTFVTDWSDSAILARSQELGVRAKHEHVPRDIRHVLVDPTVDECIKKYNGYVLLIKKETGWGKEAIVRRCQQLKIVPITAATQFQPWTYNKMYVPTDEVDAIITCAWKEHYHDGCILWASEQIKKLNKIRWSEQAISLRANELGLTHARNSWKSVPRVWSDEEEDYIKANAHFGPRKLQEGLKRKWPEKPRTQSAIAAKLTRLSAYIDEGYNQTQLSTILGVNKDKILRWTAMKQLVGIRRDQQRTESQGGNEWYYANKDIAAFVAAYPEEIDLRLVEKYAFLHILSSGKMGKT